MVTISISSSSPAKKFRMKVPLRGMFAFYFVMSIGLFVLFRWAVHTFVTNTSGDIIIVNVLSVDKEHDGSLSLTAAVAAASSARKKVPWTPTPMSVQPPSIRMQNTGSDDGMSTTVFILNNTDKSRISNSDHSDYYDQFWTNFRKEATHPGRLPSSASELPCPKVFIYNLTNYFRDELKDGDVLSVDWAFGGALDSWGNGILRETSMYSLSSIVEHRLLTPNNCYRTTNPDQADLFFVPAMVKRKTAQGINRFCSHPKANASTLHASLSYLNTDNACKHILMISQGHFLGYNCQGWFYNPLPEFKNFLRIAYTHVPAKGCNKTSGCNLQFIAPAKDPAKESLKHPNLFSVPYPSSIHWTSNATYYPWMDSSTRPRKYLMSFVGSFVHGDISVRHRIRDQCQRYNDSSICKLPESRTEGGKKAFDLVEKLHSKFCLEPSGDDPWRKSLADSITFGCIPVLFSNLTDDVAPWHWGDWKYTGRVVVDREDFIKGRVDLYHLLSSAPDDLVTMMQRTLEKNARRFQYSVEDDPEDGIHAMLTGMKAHAEELQKQGKCS